MKLSALSGAPIQPDPDIAGLTADSRAVRKGYLFAALPGLITDGANYIPQAEERGAAAILAAPGAVSPLPVVTDEEPRRRLSQMAARFYARQPKIVAGVTGTNGKSSTAHFTAQLWEMAGYSSASLGTLGVIGRDFSAPLSHTTPEPVTLHQTLDAAAAAGVTHLAMEVSSHGLAQYRADGVRFAIAAFTNITQDHLDYHADFATYRRAKFRLFTELLPDNGVAIVNRSDGHADDLIAAVKKRRIACITVGKGEADLRIEKLMSEPEGLRLSVRAEETLHHVNLPLVGAFQAENALTAAGIVMAAGGDKIETLRNLEKLRPIPGRMERVAEAGGGAIYVDYAHTPDAVMRALEGLRPHVAGQLIAIIGAGGDRDRNKRKLMGEAAARGADQVIVTDDNPRTEDPAAIRSAVMSGCPGAMEIGGRAAAIAAGVRALTPGDVLLIAGKGHEDGQTIGVKTVPFNDGEAARDAVRQWEKEGGA